MSLTETSPIMKIATDITAKLKENLPDGTVITGRADLGSILKASPIGVNGAAIILREYIEARYNVSLGELTEVPANMTIYHAAIAIYRAQSGVKI